jgi:hypothetical protein
VTVAPKREAEKVDIAADMSVRVRARATSGSARGKPSEWKLVPLDGNVDKRWIMSPPSVPATATGDDDGWLNTVTLSRAGNERHELKVTAPGGKVVKDLVLTSVRHVPITVYTTAGAPALEVWRAALPVIRKAYEPAGIVLDVTEATMDKDDAGRFARGLDEKAELSEYVRGLFSSGALPPVKSFPALRIFLVKTFEMLKDVVIANKNVSRASLRTWDRRIQVLEDGQTLPERSILEAEAYSPFRKQRVSIKGRVKPSGNFLEFNLDSKWVDYYFPDGQTDAGEVTVKFEAVESGFSGWSDTQNVIVITSHELGGTLRPKEAVARMAIHEIAHSLGHVALGNNDFSNGAKLVKNTRYYDGHWGAGPHCKTHAEEDTTHEKDQSGDYPFVRAAGQGKLCVMYNDALSADADPTFCDQCTLNLKLSDLDPYSGYRRYWTT